MDNNVDTITLTDEEGKETEFEVITKLDIEDKEYVVVVPKNEEVDEAIALRIDNNDNGEEVLVPVEEDEEFNMVAEAYELLFSEE
ncbi:hypothetical protein RSJ21_13245 [Clostridium botulinum]|uniref:UPF0473 protein CBO2561/CLC_2432 n=4 Tax=Clostridium botulinum TaxID=1491 RepID=Y2561_CLOBH|nr:DUF1292 domain-containing protein [Clostridium botulinum]A5I4Z2.1 RecName: Full=UPF0473 protein CBO2561/CLC_2432 [Clostridium botulinum A str. Hall]A7FWJ2.1 RecName: Full=UPF0473 protein CLB_2502 [Clostridium botulinum A str. ATCC 19397]A7GGE8.1 RecName: Full=UPF0473 protein CLI_2624 [Clostridium botulinum F str. Langeland]EPS46092.1 hypothetical protein CFSAN002369_28521 [Clostridium botulinum CFSAN002369]EPS47420.1 hypothetical protein CFSAN002367_23971 [Clostridium botulinum CFSAN002367]